MTNQPQSGPSWTASLLSTARSGDQSARLQVTEGFREYLTLLAARVLAMQPSAEGDPADLADRCVRWAQGQFAQFQLPVTQWQAWLVRSLRQRVLATLKAQGVSPETNAEASLGPPSEAEASRREQAALLLRTVGQLGGRDRQLMHLRMLDRLDWREIAACLEMSEAAARKRWGRALDRLKAEQRLGAEPTAAEEPDERRLQTLDAFWTALGQGAVDPAAWLRQHPDLAGVSAEELNLMRDLHQAGAILGDDSRYDAAEVAAADPALLVEEEPGTPGASWKRSVVAVVVLGLLLVAAGGIGWKLGFSGNGGSPEPPALALVEIEVAAGRPGQLTSRQVAVAGKPNMQELPRPLKPGEGFKLTGRFNRPTYWYLIWFDTRGGVAVDAISRGEEAEVVYPREVELQRIQADEPSGPQMLLLVAGSVAPPAGAAQLRAELKGLGRPPPGKGKEADEFLQKIDARLPAELRRMHVVWFSTTP